MVVNVLYFYTIYSAVIHWLDMPTAERNKLLVYETITSCCRFPYMFSIVICLYDNNNIQTEKCWWCAMLLLISSQLFSQARLTKSLVVESILVYSCSGNATLWSIYYLYTIVTLVFLEINYSELILGINYSRRGYNIWSSGL